MASVSIHQSELDDSAIGATPPFKYNNWKLIVCHVLLMASVSILQSELDDSAIGAPHSIQIQQLETNRMSRTTYGERVNSPECLSG